MTRDFDARLAKSRLPLDDDERATMRAAVSDLDRLSDWLHKPLTTQDTDPLEGWVPSGSSTITPVRTPGRWSMPTVAEMAADLESGATSARDLTELCLNRIDRHNTRLKAFLTVCADQARSDADAADSELRQENSRGPLHGIPYAMKDAFDTAGIRTTVGSRVFDKRVPKQNAELVQQLKRAGAVLIGKLDTSEFCFGGPSKDGGFGPANNPWDLPRYAGASSSGAGVAIAAGLIPLAFGTDTGGSIRLPATLTGTAGFKPSQDLISTGGVFPLSKTFDHVGPLAATAQDCALALAAIGKIPSVGDTGSIYAAGLRVGVPRGHGADMPGANPSAIKALFGTTTALRQGGSDICAIDLPPLWAFSAVSSIIVAYEGWRVHAERLASDGRRFAQLTRLRLGLGAFIEDRDYQTALTRRRLLTAAWEDAFNTVDVMLTIGSPGPAPLKSSVSAFAYLHAPIVFCAANIAGAPALVIRAGTADDGLPIGIQIAGRRGGDQLVLAVGRLLEDIRDIAPRHPPGYD